MTYLFAGLVFVVCLLLWWRTPEHETMARLFFRFGMFAAAGVALFRFIFGLVVR